MPSEDSFSNMKASESTDIEVGETDEESQKKANEILSNAISIQKMESNKPWIKRNIPTIILTITMIGILWQASEMNRSVRLQVAFNDSGLRPYLTVDPSFKAPYVDDTLIVVTSSLSNLGRTPAYNTVFVGRPTRTDTYPDSLLRSLIEEDEDAVSSIIYPGQPGITFTGESTIRNSQTLDSLHDLSINEIITSNNPLYYHVCINYESAWNKEYYLRFSYKYEGGTMWSTIFASENPTYTDNE